MLLLGVCSQDISGVRAIEQHRDVFVNMSVHRPELGCRCSHDLDWRRPLRIKAALRSRYWPGFCRAGTSRNIGHTLARMLSFFHKFFIRIRCLPDRVPYSFILSLRKQAFPLITRVIFLDRRSPFLCTLWTSRMWCLSCRLVLNVRVRHIGHSHFVSARPKIGSRAPYSFTFCRNSVASSMTMLPNSSTLSAPANRSNNCGRNLDPVAAPCGLT